MTDKQIMIDGVDVSGCECYNPNIKMNCILHPLQSDACKNNPNCCYKQLARKEQECKELKEINSTLLEYHRHAVTCQECYEDGLEDGKTSNKELRKLKQTLTDIKEIAEPYKMPIKKICGNCKKYDDCHACCYKDINCYKYTSADTNACEEFTYSDEFVPNILANNILQKISECEMNNEN